MTRLPPDSSFLQRADRSHNLGFTAGAMEQFLKRVVMQQKCKFCQQMQMGLHVGGHKRKENGDRLAVYGFKINGVSEKAEADGRFPRLPDDRIPDMGNCNAVPEGR